MAVNRIVANIANTSIDDVRTFYMALFDLNVVMDQGWIVMLSSEQTAPVQMSIAIQGGSGTRVPDLSIEVDDVDAVYQRAQALGLAIAYELTDEPWGVRRFYVSDPAGKLLNVLSHID